MARLFLIHCDSFLLYHGPWTHKEGVYTYVPRDVGGGYRGFCTAYSNHHGHSYCHYSSNISYSQYNFHIIGITASVHCPCLLPWLSFGSLSQLFLGCLRQVTTSETYGDGCCQVIVPASHPCLGDQPGAGRLRSGPDQAIGCEWCGSLRSNDLFRLRLSSSPNVASPAGWNPVSRRL